MHPLFMEQPAVAVGQDSLPCGILPIGCHLF